MVVWRKWSVRHQAVLPKQFLKHKLTGALPSREVSPLSAGRKNTTCAPKGTGILAMGSLVYCKGMRLRTWAIVISLFPSLSR